MVLPALGCQGKHADQGHSICCGWRQLERWAQKAAKASARPRNDIPDLLCSWKADSSLVQIAVSPAQCPTVQPEYQKITTISPERAANIGFSYDRPRRKLSLRIILDLRTFSRMTWIIHGPPLLSTLNLRGFHNLTSWLRKTKKLACLFLRFNSVNIFDSMSIYRLRTTQTSICIRSRCPFVPHIWTSHSIHFCTPQNVERRKTLHDTFVEYFRSQYKQIKTYLLLKTRHRVHYMQS